MKPHWVYESHLIVGCMPSNCQYKIYSGGFWKYLYHVVLFGQSLVFSLFLIYIYIIIIYIIYYDFKCVLFVLFLYVYEDIWGRGMCFLYFSLIFFYFFILFLNSDFFARERKKVFGLWWLQRWRGFGRTGGGGIIFKKRHIHA